MGLNGTKRAQWQCMNNDTDWELVARARAGDANAFVQLVERYQTPVIHFCQRMVGVRQDAEDLAQETFVRVYKHLGTLRKKAEFSTFLFGIARNLALNALRDRARHARRVEHLREEKKFTRPRRPDEMARVDELKSLVEDALRMLNPEYREVLILREYHDMDYDTIARITGIRKGTVRSRLARAREQVRQFIREKEGDIT